jgi:2-methylisocitrate lyase-like PEP mutase family enzyme
MVDLAATASAFRRMHELPGILAPPNACDAATARVFDDGGFAAIGATSSGIATAMGYPDDESISRDEMLETAQHK